MAVWELYSKRQKRKNRKGEEDVFQYEDLPRAFRVQVVHILRDALGECRNESRSLGPGIHHKPNDWWSKIYQIITREKGVFQLSELGIDPSSQCFNYLMTAPTEDALDFIELTFQFVNRYVRSLNEYEQQHWVSVHPDAAIEELNTRFREHGIGYEFAGGEIVRVDSKFIHAEAVKPAIQLLYGAGSNFSGPLEEFLRAHEYHRKGEQKDAISWALKAFESTLKAICTDRNWPFDAQKDTASKLLEIVFTNGLVAPYLQAHFGALKSVLESGVPTTRNKTSGHGQGAVPISVPAHLVAYILHLTASNIVFLIESHKTTKLGPA